MLSPLARQLGPLGSSARRRTGPFGPLSLSPAVWLKADSGAYQDAAKSNACTDGSLLYTWGDQSGNGLDASQATSGVRPTWAASAQNGLPGVYMKGAYLNLGALASRFPSAATVCAAFSADSDSQVYCLFDDGSTAGGATPWWSYYGTGYFGPFCSSRINGYPSSFPQTGSHIASVVAGSQYQVFLDGTGQGATSYTFSPGGSNFLIGANSGLGIYFHGYLYELIVYPTALSDSDRGRVESYLSTRWGI